MEHTLEEKQEAQMYTYQDLVSALKATRMEYEGITISEVAQAFPKADWSKEEVESLVRELAQRYE